jgi:hypothetical protein
MSTKVNLGTKKADELIHDFLHYHYKGKTLWDVYKSVSSKKAESWRKIERECESLNGFNLHITGASCHNYSCIYAFQNEDDNIVLRKETVGNTYELELEPGDYVELIEVPRGDWG